MSESDLVQSWVVIIGLFVVAPMLSRPTIRRYLVRVLGPGCRVLAAWFQRAYDLDDEDTDLSWCRRREVLHDRVDRLQRLVAVDDTMSATRQIANRLAYGQLLRELAMAPDLPPEWPEPRVASYPTSYAASYDAPVVEVLDIRPWSIMGSRSS